MSNLSAKQLIEDMYNGFSRPEAEHLASLYLHKEYKKVKKLLAKHFKSEDIEKAHEELIKTFICKGMKLVPTKLENVIPFNISKDDDTDEYHKYLVRAGSRVFISSALQYDDSDVHFMDHNDSFKLNEVDEILEIILEK